VEQIQKERLLTREEVERRIGHSCSWIYAMVAKLAFPAPIRLSGTSSVRWLESRIDAYIEDQIRQNEEAKVSLRGTVGDKPALESRHAAESLQPIRRQCAGRGSKERT
jgi:predicted DNA-binding transcriptional regulator AlpA